MDNLYLPPPEKLSDRKAAIYDCDGTLLLKGHTAREDSRNVLESQRKAGVKIFVVRIMQITEEDVLKGVQELGEFDDLEKDAERIYEEEKRWTIGISVPVDEETKRKGALQRALYEKYFSKDEGAYDFESINPRLQKAIEKQLIERTEDDLEKIGLSDLVDEISPAVIFLGSNQKTQVNAKKNIFQRIISENNLKPNNVTVIGDQRLLEGEAASQLSKELSDQMNSRIEIPFVEVIGVNSLRDYKIGEKMGLTPEKQFLRKPLH